MQQGAFVTPVAQTSWLRPRPARASRPAGGPWDASSPRTWARDSLQGPPGVAYRGRAPKCNTGYIPIANINVVHLQPCAMSSRRGCPDKINGVLCFEWIEEHLNHPNSPPPLPKSTPI